LTADPELVTRVRDKLRREPIEDLRIDFEDGYGDPATTWKTPPLAPPGAYSPVRCPPGERPFVSIRFTSFERPTRRRGIRTLDVFLGGLLEHGLVPAGFVVTLPKVTAIEQVEAAAEVLGKLETGYGLAASTLRFEVQIETPQSILAADGTVAVSRIVQAAAGRCSGLHYRTYDYSAALGIGAAYQSMEHPAADFAKAFMQVAAAGTGVRRTARPTGSRWAIATRCGPPGANTPTSSSARSNAVLPGLGPASAPASEPVHGDVRLLPRGASGGRRSAPRLRREDRRRRAARARDRAGARRVLDAGPRLRRARRTRGHSPHDAGPAGLGPARPAARFVDRACQPGDEAGR
jgi:hypothetical protein